jgi:hypothetical protein
MHQVCKALFFQYFAIFAKALCSLRHRGKKQSTKRNLCDPCVSAVKSKAQRKTLCAPAVKNCTTKEHALLVYGKNAPPSREERKEKNSATFAVSFLFLFFRAE